MSDLSLGSHKWGVFRLGDIFNSLVRGNNKSLNDLGSGDSHPYVGAKYSDNGIAGFVDRGSKAKIFQGNAVVFVMTGEGSVGKAVYKFEQFVPSNNVFVGYSAFLNRWSGLFLVTAINNGSDRYNYGYIRNEKRLRNEKILLPINPEGNPDWLVMEDFVKQREEDQINKLREYYSNKALSLMMSLGQIKDREWKEFFIGGENGVFDIRATQSGIDKNKLNAVVGDTPYVTRSDLDNGINLLVSDEQDIKYSKDKGNAITIGLDTQTVFYQKNSFWTGQNIQVLRNEYLNYWVAMFVIPLLKIQMKKFSWGSTGATLGRLNRTKIMLPVNASDCPDWQFMEDFMKKIEQDKTSIVLDYYNSQKYNENLSGGGGG